MNKCILYSTIVLLMIVISCSSKKVINEQQIKLSLDNYGYPVNEFSYVMGVGDLNGDEKMDFIVRVFSEANKLKNDFETRSFAYQHDGTLLWELNHHIIPSEFSFEPCAIVPLTIWDFNNDGKAEVVTLIKKNEQYHLVMIDGIEGPDKILYQAELPEASKYVYGALAYLDGINPYVVIATGRESKVIAFDRTLKRVLQLDDPKYYSNHDCCWLLPYDFDDDGHDELVHGTLLLNEDLTVYMDATTTLRPYMGFTERSFVADIDPDNSGYEWYIQRDGKSGEYFVQPNYWKGPYLLDVDMKKILWHANTDIPEQGWGRLHRGWLQDIYAEVPGLEMFCTGYFWQGNEWRKNLANQTEIVPNSVWAGDYSETFKLYSAKGEELVSSQGYRVGYPVLWDDDPDAEYFMYRNGNFLENFISEKCIAKLASHDGSGECTIADIMGDWHEEIIITDNKGIVHIYSNPKRSKIVKRPLRECHNYRMHMASIGNGLPKPVPPDADWEKQQ